MYWNDLTKTLHCYSNREPLSLLWKPGLKVRKKICHFTGKILQITFISLISFMIFEVPKGGPVIHHLNRDV